MNTQVNWKKLRDEFQRLADVDKLKSEVQRIGQELRNFDFHSVLSPAAATKVKTFEKRYSSLMRTIHQAQRQVDREFNRILRQIKVHRTDVDRVVTEQKKNLEQVSVDLKKRFTKKAATARTTAGKTARTAARRKKTVRRRRKA